jgi:hypothetical protein
MRVRARRAFLVDAAIGRVLAVTSWMPFLLGSRSRGAQRHRMGAAKWGLPPRWRGKAEESLAPSLLFPLTIVPARLLD